MNTLFAAKIYLACLFVIWVGYGTAVFVSPAILAGYTGMEFNSPTALTEVRAMYGGAQIAIGLSALSGLLCSSWIMRAIWLQFVLTSGLGLSRLLGVFLDGSPDTYTWGAVSFELCTAVIGILIYRQLSAISAVGETE